MPAPSARGGHRERIDLAHGSDGADTMGAGAFDAVIFAPGGATTLPPATGPSGVAVDLSDGHAERGGDAGGT